MITFKQFTADPKLKADALTFLSQVTLSSKLGTEPREEVLEYLRASVDNKVYTVYRGLSLGRIQSHEKKELYSLLAVGKPVPEKYAIPDSGQTVIHTTTKLSVAKRYARGGAVSIVYAIEVPSNFIIFDSNNINNCFNRQEVPADDWNYFRSEAEVLVSKKAQFKTSIISFNIV